MLKGENYEHILFFIIKIIFFSYRKSNSIMAIFRTLSNINLHKNSH